MSFMFEVYYRGPKDNERERDIVAFVAQFGGRMTFQELVDSPNNAVCLTFEFGEIEFADRAAKALRLRDEHVEGPYDY